MTLGWEVIQVGAISNTMVNVESTALSTTIVFFQKVVLTWEELVRATKVFPTSIAATVCTGWVLSHFCHIRREESGG